MLTGRVLLHFSPPPIHLSHSLILGFLSSFPNNPSYWELKGDCEMTAPCKCCEIGRSPDEASPSFLPPYQFHPISTGDEIAMGERKELGKERGGGKL